MRFVKNTPNEDGKGRSLAEAHEEIKATLEEIKAFQRQVRHPYVKKIMTGKPGEAVLDD